MEGESELEFETVTCPICQHQFFPKPIKTAYEKAARLSAPPPAPDLKKPAVPSQTPEEKAAWEAKIQRDQLAERINRLQSLGSGLAGFSVFLFGVGIILLLCGALSQPSSMGLVFAGGSFVGSAFWLFIAGQIVHIRANTEK